MPETPAVKAGWFTRKLAQIVRETIREELTPFRNELFQELFAPPAATEPKSPCKSCGGRMVLWDLSFCPACTKHIRPLPYVLDLQGAVLSKAAIVDFARIIGWHRIACWTGHRDALLGIPDLESVWVTPAQGLAMDGQIAIVKTHKEQGKKEVLFGRPIRTADYAPTDRLLSYDLAGDWTGQIINIGLPANLTEVPVAPVTTQERTT